MPIDFNPHLYLNIQPQIIRPCFKMHNSLEKDIFIKSIDKNYEGIKIEKKDFGRIEKSKNNATLYTITNKNGASVDISTFGATITGIKVPNREGKLIDVTHGYNTVTPYEKSPVGHAGGTIGPYANKISDGRFTLDGKDYYLECNKDNGQNHSHGGSEGFDVQNWEAEVLKDGIKLTYMKKDMENGYPANVTTSVIYKFDNNNKLHISYQAVSDNDTILNITNHTYFNLDGAENTEKDSVLDHIVKLPNSTSITEVNEIGIPTGKLLNTTNTPFDFSNESKLSDKFKIPHPQLTIAKGFDHNYCVDNYDGEKLVDVAEIKSEKTGIKLTISTNLPGFQFYTANNLGKETQPCGKDGKKYQKYSGVCVEPQFYPNAINTESFAEKGILKAGEKYKKDIVYSFNIE